MNYGLVINIGYAGTVIFAILTIYLCFKLNLKNCILEVTGLERKKRVKEWKEGGLVKDKKERKRSSKKAAEKRKNIMPNTEVLTEPSSNTNIQQEKKEFQDTVLLAQGENTDELCDNTQLEEQRDLEFVYLKDIVVVHTKERIE